MKTLERRSLSGIELRESTAGPGFIAKLSGYAAVFNSDSAPIMNEQRKRPFIERILPGAFSETLAEKRDAGDEIFSFWAHRDHEPLGRRGANLKLWEDDHGLKFELDVPDSTVGRDLTANIRAGIVTGVSFGFRAIKEDVVRGSEYDVRSLVKVKLHEVSPTTIPAYAETSIDFRSHSKLCEMPVEVRSLAFTCGEPEVQKQETEKPIQISNTEDNREARLRILCK